MTEQPPDESMSRGRVDVWLVDLGSIPVDDQQIKSLLSVDELERADRFLRPQDTQRFIAARASLRTVLGRYIGIEPAGMEFGYGEFGKPFLMPPLDDGNVCFNISHSECSAAIAVCRRMALGIDIEFGSRIDSPASLAKVLLSPAEHELFQRLSVLHANDQRVESIDASVSRFVLGRWTLKEAFLKGVGAGLSQALSEIELREISGEIAMSEAETRMHAEETAMPAAAADDTALVSAGAPARFEVLVNGDLQTTWRLEQRSLGRDGSLALAINQSPSETALPIKFHTFEL